MIHDLRARGDRARSKASSSVRTYSAPAVRGVDVYVCLCARARNGGQARSCIMIRGELYYERVIKRLTFTGNVNANAMQTLRMSEFGSVQFDSIRIIARRS